MGKGLFTDVYLSVPETAQVGAMVLVRTTVKSYVIGATNIRVVVTIDGAKVIDSILIFGQGHGKYYDYGLQMPDHNVTVVAESYIEYQGSWHIDASANRTIVPRAGGNGDDKKKAIPWGWIAAGTVIITALAVGSKASKKKSGR